jgi:single-strand DNA-binding protein
MSKGFSFAQIGGTLGKDPESRATPNGTKVVSFSLAVDKGFGDNLKTNWFNIVAFRDQAEFAEKYLKKGKSVFVSGDLQNRTWEDKQGQKRTTAEIIAYKIDFADSGSKSDSGSRTATGATAVRQQAAPPVRTTAPATEESDPFGDEPF